MIYKRKTEYYEAVLKYYNNCISKGMLKGEANRVTREHFFISSPDTIYKISRRVNPRNEEKTGGKHNG